MFGVMLGGIGKHVRDRHCVGVKLYQALCILVSPTSRYFNRYDNRYVTIRTTEKEYKKCYLNEPDCIH